MLSANKNAFPLALMICVLAVMPGCSKGDSPVTPVMPSPVPSVVTPTPTPQLQLGVAVLHTIGGPCAGCLVEITSGPGAGATGTTGSSGTVTFQIPAVGTVSVRAAKDGYRTVTKTVTIDGSRSTTFETLTIESVLSPIDLSGSRVLELRADAACPQLPSEVGTRTYAVSVVKVNQNAFRFDPANGVVETFRVWALVSGNDVNISIEENERSGDGGIVEQLPSGNWLSISGFTGGFAVSNLDTISHSVRGEISVCDASVKCSRCNSNNHQLTLTRR